VTSGLDKLILLSPRWSTSLSSSLSMVVIQLQRNSVVGIVSVLSSSIGIFHVLS
jgi:hypothetical protein